MKNYKIITCLSFLILICAQPSFSQTVEQDDDPDLIEYVVEENPNFPMPLEPCDPIPPLALTFSHTDYASLEPIVLTPGTVIDGYSALLGDPEDPALGIRASVNGVVLNPQSHILSGIVYSVCCGCTVYNIHVDINVEYSTVTISYIPAGLCLDCDHDDNTGNEGQ